MKNIVLKTALKTFLALLIALLLAFGVASLGFPQHMATFFENVGNYSFATGYASLRYTYTGDVSDLARCVDDSIYCGNDDNIISFGEKLVGHSGFKSYCVSRDNGSSPESMYRQFVYGNIAKSKYNKGDKDAALDCAVEGMNGIEGFPINNSVALLAVRVAQKKDAETARKLLDTVNTYTPLTSEEEYFGKVINVLNNLLSGA